MKSLLFACPVKRPLPVLLRTMGALSCFTPMCLLAQASRPGQIQSPMYGAPAYRQPPAYQPQGYQPQGPQSAYPQPQGNGYAQPNNYRPPQPTVPQAPRPAATKKSTSARTGSSGATADPASYHKLATKVAELSSNDRRQDQRLHSLERKGGVRPPSGDAPNTPGVVPYVKYVVRPGDTLWRIAAKHKVSINDIRTFNRMPNDTIAVNQVLMIPDPKAPVTPSKLDYPKSGSSSTLAYDYGLPSSKRGVTHVVRPGQSLGAIAKSYGIPTATLASANKLKNPNDLQVGQKLTVPVSGSSSSSSSSKFIAKTSSVKPKTFVPSSEPEMMPMPGHGLSSVTSHPTSPAPAPASPPPPMPAAAPKSTESSHRGVLAYRVVRGDDVNTIANLFGTTPQKIREMNKLGATGDVSEGEEIVVPSMSAVSVN